MASSVANIRIEPVNVSLKNAEQDCWEFADAVAASLADQYVTMDLPDGGTSYYAWFNLDAGGSDPAPGGTAIPVAVSTGDSASTIAAAFQAAVDGVSGFTATVSGTVVTSTRDDDGTCVDSTVGDTSLITLTKAQNGTNIDLGLLSGDVEVSMEETTLELTAHQTGTSLRADLRQGANATVSLTIQESDNPLRKLLFNQTAGSDFTPAAGTNLYGWGDGKQGLSSITDAGRLIFHPVALAAGDLSRDLCFWKSYPLISSITFSGENAEVMAIEFKCYIDESRPSGINLFAFGDHTQSGIVAS